MGEVFLAKAGPKGFERYFAIKRILTKLEGVDNFEEMLLNEARISISLVHPNWLRTPGLSASFRLARWLSLPGARMAPVWLMQ